LKGVKEYKDSHDFIIEIIRRLPEKKVTKSEWQIIGEICIHRYCWKKIEELYGKRILSILEKVKDFGWGEYYDYYVNYLKKNEE